MSDDDARQAASASLAVSRSKLSNGDLTAALRFCRKSLSLYETPAAKSFLRELEALEKEGGPSPKASTSAAARPAPSPAPSMEQPQRSYTPKQVAMIKRVRACKPGAYYEVLELEKSCSDGDIKKAFRKSVLLLHPDKCGAPGTDEAFKIVAKAAEVLGDPNKRAHFDRYGTDPDDRRAGMGSGGFSSAASPFGPGGMRRGPMYSGGEDLTPEDLFNMFFGGGSTFSGGFGPNVRVYSAGGGGRPRPAAAGGQQTANSPAWLQMLPLIVLALFSLLSYIPAMFTPSAPPMPGFRFTPAASYQHAQSTHLHSVNYFVDPAAFAQSHVFKAVLTANPSINKASPLDVLQTESLNALRIPAELHKFERQVEAAYVDRVSAECRSETTTKQERLNRANGFLGIGRDVDELRRIHAEPMPGCEALKRMGYRLS